MAWRGLVGLMMMMMLFDGGEKEIKQDWAIFPVPGRKALSFQTQVHKCLMKYEERRKIHLIKKGLYDDDDGK